MHPHLQKLFDTIEKQKQELLLQIESHSSAQLQHSPPGKWSLGQVYAHLIASEQLSVQYLRKKYLGIEAQPPTGIVEELKMLILVISQRLPFKFKAPKLVTDHTPSFRSQEEIAQAWNQTRQELKEVLDGFQDHHLNRKVYKHPVAGMLNIQQALRFFREHLIHHTPQIKKLLKQK
ncbi:MAG: DinB family protein [Bacteroidetes bacterium CHB5]|nr:DinB family protein [Bacteroidetes bacterium CHB5]